MISWLRRFSHFCFKRPPVFNDSSSITRSVWIRGTDETVFALSSGHGKAGVAVVRVSGAQSSEVISKIGKFIKLPKPRVATLRKLTDPNSGTPIDHGLVIWFPGPNSFTGEDSAEFHVHGGSAVVLALLDTLSKLPGLKHAEPGDFTKRAFFNGKLDLTEVEGLADLIHAETESQRMQALRQMEGDLSKLYSKWSTQLLKCVAHVEAIIDFGEEENIEDDVVLNVVEKVKMLIEEICDHLNDGRKGERLRSGINVAIIGAPNVGKSSLLNILCQRPAAIVSEYAGTTRDVVESSLDIFGYPIVLSDTAGLRAVNNPVEEEGIRRAVQKGEQADLKIVMASSLSLQSYMCQSSVSEKSLADFAKIALDYSSSNSSLAVSLKSQDTIIVMNKTDLHSPAKRFLFLQGAPVAWISCKTRDGIESFLHILKKQLQDLGGNPLADSPRLTQARHRHHLKLCFDSLEQFLNNVSDEASLVIAAEELREALQQLGRITGSVGIEDILDVVFREFCIGK